MGLRYSDTQCGFKLFTAEAAERLFCAARIDGFMFDAETLINARKFGLTVKEFPVEWRADPIRATSHSPAASAIDRAVADTTTVTVRKALILARARVFASDVSLRECPSRCCAFTTGL